MESSQNHDGNLPKIPDAVTSAAVDAWEMWNQYNCGHCGRSSATQTDWDALPDDDDGDDDFGMCWARVSDSDCVWTFNDIDPRRRALAYVVTAIAPLLADHVEGAA